jgi:predicted regulator of Ras-like GTPase activity (Roadblock/LC7/MglB family)
MQPMPMQQAALDQLAATPGVVGSMVFDLAGIPVATAFPPVFDASGLASLAGRLAADGYFNEWMSGDRGAMDLQFGDGHVMVRSLSGHWLLVLCTAQVNTQLLSMSLTQVVRRLRASGAWGSHAEHPLKAAAPAPPPSVVDRLRALVGAELGSHAAQALEILAATGAKPTELLRATGEVEKLTRLFIDKKKAEEIGRRMRAIIEE